MIENAVIWPSTDDPEELRKHYELILPAIRAAAKAKGYAIGVHGSLRRDFDLMAMPWIEHYADADILADTVQRAATGVSGMWERFEKPNGRMVYRLPIGRYAYIDLSVMPGEAK